jgi:hypothetical protein
MNITIPVHGLHRNGTDTDAPKIKTLLTKAL